MRKIFSILSIMLLYTSLIIGQAVNIPITVTDNGTGTKVLNFGLDLTATNGIDPALGESDLPPFPPAGVAEFRFDLTPYNTENLSSYKDYRNPPGGFPFTGNIQHRLWWQLSAGATTLTVAYSLPPAAKMTIIDLVGGALFNSGLLSGSGSYVITFASVVQQANLNIEYTGITPVELTSFTALQFGETVQLAWITATEINNKGFDLERKTQNSGWEKLSFIEGHGTTTEIQSYSYIDDFSNNTVSGPVLYRLKQIDFDGTTSYSKEIQVDLDFTPDQYQLLQNYPNPFNPSTGIRYAIPFTSNVKVVVYNMLGETMGEIVNQVQEAGYYDVVWTASNQSSGIYLYTLEAKSLDGQNSYSSIKKMMLLK